MQNSVMGRIVVGVDEMKSWNHGFTAHGCCNQVQVSFIKLLFSDSEEQKFQFIHWC